MPVTGFHMRAILAFNGLSQCLMAKIQRKTSNKSFLFFVYFKIYKRNGIAKNCNGITPMK